MNNRTPVSRIPAATQSEYHKQNHDYRTQERIEDGIRGRDKPEVHLIYENFFSFYSINTTWVAVLCS
jgi:hypothetical protein